MEEKVGGAAARDAVHLPRRDEGPALRDADGVVVIGVEAAAVPPGPQAHVGPVGEEIHRGSPVVGGGGRVGLLALREESTGEEKEKSGRERLDAEPKAGDFEAWTGKLGSAAGIS